MQRRRTTSGLERRKFARVSDDLVISCTPLDDGPSEFEGRPLNFSAGGVAFVSAARYLLGQHVEIVLNLAGEAEPLVVTGCVARVRSHSDHQHETAIEFFQGNVEAQRNLIEYIEVRCQNEPEPFFPVPA